MYILTISVLISTFFSCLGAATGHDAHQEVLDAIYLLQAQPHGICYTDFMTAKQHHPDVAMAIQQCIDVKKGCTAFQLQSSSLSIGKKLVISCHVAGLNMAEQMRRIKPEVVNIAHDIAQSIRCHWIMHIMAKDVTDTSRVYLPNGRQFYQALFNAHFTSYTNIAAFCIIASHCGATAYFMKQHPRIDEQQICIARKEMQWLGNERACTMAKQRQQWILKHPDMKILTTTDPAASLDPSTFDYAFDINGKAIADYFASQESDLQLEPKRQRRG